MTMADFSKPTVTSTKANFPQEVRELAEALGVMEHSQVDNPPVGLIRVNQTTGRLQKWSGAAWVSVTFDPTPVGTYIAKDDSPGALYLLCDGTVYNIADYPDLGALLGNRHGGNGTTTFAVPNLKGRALVGYDPAQTEFDALGKTGGAKTHTLSSGEMPTHNHTGATGAGTAHAHSVNDSGHAHQMPTDPTAGAASFLLLTNAVSATPNGSTSTATTGITIANESSHYHGINSDGSGTAHNNLQPYFATKIWVRI